MKLEATMEKNVPHRREVLFIFTLCQQILTSSSVDTKGLYLDQSLKTWTQASKDCLLVTPNTTLSLGVPLRDIPILQRPTCKTTTRRPHHGDHLWIGAIGTFTPWFELLGCFLYEKFENNPNIFDSTSILDPVTECYRICRNYDNIGINNDTCICAQNVTYGKISRSCKFSTSVSFKNDIIGTNENINNYLHQGFAMYRKINITKIDDTSGECLIMTNKGNKTFPCNSQDILNRTWTESFISIANLNENKTLDLPNWLPYLRRLVIKSNNGTEMRALTPDNAQQDGTVCISVKDQNGVYELVPMRCNEKYFSICQSEITKMLTGSTVPVIIGSVVGIVCILIIAIVIIIKKRNQSKRNFSSSTSTENVHYTDITLESGKQLMVKGTSFASTNNPNYDTISSDNGIKTTKESKEYGHLLHIGQTDLYNHTWDKPITEQLTDHVYNTASSGNDISLYDHTVTKWTNFDK
ncbi:uncharacterized protein LOC133174918 [Saccostrea echinata]|uniref:uncharacterized protein LOC133174918 n=1 Tax=Saccostrea echinata TaxID=191078 RepID=UPI002A83B47B|nr:uncharacterized protein LOC133174918 [Saccostrea echinata]